MSKQPAKKKMKVGNRREIRSSKMSTLGFEAAQFDIGGLQKELHHLQQSIKRAKEDVEFTMSFNPNLRSKETQNALNSVRDPLARALLKVFPHVIEIYHRDRKAAGELGEGKKTTLISSHEEGSSGGLNWISCKGMGHGYREAHSHQSG